MGPSKYQNDGVKISSSQVKNVAIIGGGASGAISLDSLIQENHFESITLIERKGLLGGIWNLDETKLDTPHEILKPGFTNEDIDPQLPNPFTNGSNNSANVKILLRPKIKQNRFEETPSYKGMQTNIDRMVMTFSDKTDWFPIKSKKDYSYVDRSVVQRYIEEYINKHEGKQKVKILRKTSVEDVEKIVNLNAKEGELPYKFKLTMRKSVDEKCDAWFQEIYDSVIIAVGHYFVPYFPKVKGLQELQQLAPRIVSHSKYFRDKQDYKGEKAIVVGSRASGADLAKYLADTNEKVYQSIRNIDNTKIKTKKKNVYFKPVIQEFKILSLPNEPLNFKVIFSDNTEVTNPDYIIYATGYQWSFPFLNRYAKNLEYNITLNGKIIQKLYQHTFMIDEPLLAFVGVPVDGISFRVFEYQAIIIARYLAGKISLPTREEQEDWVYKRLQEKGVTRAYHTLGFEDAVKYSQEIIALGTVKNNIKVGREFPVYTEKILERAAIAAKNLQMNWDQRV